MKNWKLLLCSSIMIVNTSFAATQIVDKIVAIVNNDIILASDIDWLKQYIKISTDSQIEDKFINEKTLRYQLLKSLIIDKIILQIGQIINVKVSNYQVNQVISNIAKLNNITVNQMRLQFIKQRINYDNYFNQIKKEMIIALVQNEKVLPFINISPWEVDTVVKQIENKKNANNTQFNLSEFFISLPENLTFNQILLVENQARVIAQQIRKNHNYDNLLNIDFNNQKIKFKQIGWKYIQELPYIFAQELYGAKIGDIIGPIKSSIGLHILKINNLRTQNYNNSLITKVHVYHILVKSSPMISDNKIQIKLKKIAKDIKNRKMTFSQAVKDFSEDFKTINCEGDLGWTDIKSYSPFIQKILLNLNKGELSSPVHSSLGWHILKLLDIKRIDINNVKERSIAYKILFHRKFLEANEIWIQKQYNNSYIKIINN